VHKSDVVAALLAGLRDELASLERLTQAARDEATSPESRPENKYDTRATEASYLAVGQGQRMVALRRLTAFLETDGRVDLFHVDGAKGEGWFLLAPDGGGRRLSVAGDEVVVVTAESPVGGALVGAQAGDSVRLGPPGAALDYEVLAVS